MTPLQCSENASNNALRLRDDLAQDLPDHLKGDSFTKPGGMQKMMRGIGGMAGLKGMLPPGGGDFGG